MEEAIKKLNAVYKKKCAELHEFEKKREHGTRDAFVQEDLLLRKWYENELIKIKDEYNSERR